MQTDLRILETINQFPAEFQLRAFQGKTFRFSPANSYIDNQNRVILYSQILWNGEWLDHSKGTSSEFASEIVIRKNAD